MFIISISDDSARVPVDVAKVADLDQAIAFGYNLHKISSCKHVVRVQSGTDSVATFIRKDTFVIPAPAPAQSAPVPASSKKRGFTFARKDSSYGTEE